MSSPARDPYGPYVRLAVVALIRRDVDEKEEWLLLQRQLPVDSLGSPGSQVWDPPGGRLEWGEDLKTAVRREAREETGLTIEPAGPCYAFLTYYKGERLLAVSLACRLVGSAEAVRLESEEATAWRWLTVAEWETLASRGESSWAPADVVRATRAAAVLLELDTAERES